MVLVIEASLLQSEGGLAVLALLLVVLDLKKILLVFFSFENAPGTNGGWLSFYSQCPV